ncbi:TetR/AcrR family transcriptional regulator [Aquicoccus porphyridii]|uniref:TetR/AcrR family transcriptional regulator n=1 Tax=Aquicoccus porphyridii TaxID=1852029 RepID=A0A5A9ZH04_9RHOB|nr:TetR/AcrR family transcriptional regulator [Aquicoccus porphyridii]KAA0916329.1 TetR/AcrR family transcriptional regulator [Aquicoccus porphyridii]RAI53546.1 TetR/AcrR family transcriptional regulator [Rhodobacteraceae bacterium AsT-22]
MTQQAQQEAREAPGGARADAILDAAELVFASSGYEGAALREIAERAGVAQGLIHYHFGNKARLFEKMVARRSGQINAARAERLAHLRAEGALHLEEIVEALFRPTIETGLELAEDGGGFARILVSMANSNDPLARDMTETYYDPIAHDYIAALQEAEPGLGRADAVWAYMFAIGVGMTMMAKTGRPKRLSDGLCDDGDADAMLARIVPFICGGVRALVTT